MSIVTQGYSSAALVTQGYGGGFLGKLLDLFRPQINSLKQRFQIRWLT